MLRTVTGPADGAVVLAVAPREALAALVAVTARRTYSDVVAVTAGTTAEVDLATDPPFADLCALVEPLLDGARSVDVGGTRLVVADGTARLYADTNEVASQVERALIDATREPCTRISVLDLASTEDLEAVARFGRGAEPAAVRTVPDLVRARAAAQPDAPAVTGGGLTLSYRELVHRADAVARALVAAGVRPDEVVGVFGVRSTGLVTALLAVLGAGGAYLALPPDWPDARVAALLDDADVRVVLTDPGLEGRVPAGRTVVPFDAPEQATAVTLPEDISPDALAYVSYTSGSTGEPKGVCVPHRAVARLCDCPDWITLGPGDTVLQAAPVAFDASTFELWGALAAGARLALLPPGSVDPAALGAVLVDEGVTVLWLTAGLFHQMVDNHVDRLGGIRHLLAGGDVVSPDAVRRLLDAFPDIVFTNGYGPTENTTFTACGTFRHGGVDDGPLPIGRPICGTSVRVLDPLGRPVPPGVVGHLHALGVGLARGYLGKPAATAAAFTPADGGGRQYRTGDLARWRADGMLEFIGRADDQVKVNGYRVEPGEVAALLRGHPGVAAAEVAAEPGPGGGARLVAYVVPAGRGPTQRELREWALARVPEFLVPAKVLTLDRFPLTGNGKLDRAALARLASGDQKAPEVNGAPETPLERYLCWMWAEALKVDEVGVDDDFFELGGHSLIAADLLGRLQEELGVELSARTFYLSPTIAELAESDELRPLRDRVRLSGVFLPSTGAP